MLITFGKIQHELVEICCGNRHGVNTYSGNRSASIVVEKQFTKQKVTKVVVLECIFNIFSRDKEIWAKLFVDA